MIMLQCNLPAVTNYLIFISQDFGIIELVVCTDFALRSDQTICKHTNPKFVSICPSSKYIYLDTGYDAFNTSKLYCVEFNIKLICQ